MSQFPKADLDALEVTYYGEVTNFPANTALDKSYYGQVIGIDSVDSNRFWVGGAAGDTTNWNNALNWASTSGGTGGAGVPTISKVVYFDTNSNAYACTATAAMVCQSMLMSGYTNNFNSAGYSFTSADGITFSTSGSVNLTNTTLSGSGILSFLSTGTVDLTNSTLSIAGNFTAAATLTTLVIGGATLNFNATGNMLCKTSATDWKRINIGTGAVMNIVTTGITIKDDADGILTLADATSQIYLSSAGCTIYCNGTHTPVVDNGGKIWASTGYSFKFMTTALSTITLPKIDSTTNLLLSLNINANVSTTFKAGNSISCRQITLDNTFNAPGNTAVFDTDGKAITIGRLSMASSNSTTSNVTNVYFRNSVVNFIDYLGTYGKWVSTTVTSNVINLYLNDSTVTHTSAFAGAYDNLPGGSGVFNLIPGNSTVSFVGAAAKTLDSAGQSYNILSVNHNSANTFDFTTALSCARLLIEPNTIVRFKEGLTHAITSYTTGDWDGTTGNLVTIKSITDGQQHTLTVPSGINVSYVNVRDSIASAKITALLSNGCIDSGNTSNWVFTAGSWFLLASRNELYRSRNI